MFEKLKNEIEILVCPAVQELLIKTCKISLFWLITQELLPPKKIIASFTFLGQFISRCLHYYFLKCVDNFEIEHKTCYILVWVQFPLKLIGISSYLLKIAFNFQHPRWKAVSQVLLDFRKSSLSVQCAN